MLDASKRDIRVMPERPAMMLDQAVWTPIPTGDTMPNPVTTTLRRDKLTPQLADEIDGWTIELRD